MQKKPYVLPIIGLLLVAGCTETKYEEKPVSSVDFSIQPETPAPHSMTEKSALQRELEFAAGTNLLSAEYLPQIDSNRTYYTHHSLTETLISMVDPEFLEKYEGSYTMHDLKNSDSDSASYTLKSSWVTGNRAPSVGIHIERNPATGHYEVNGGEIFLPESGVGISYEESQETGESQTFLNWQRDF